MREKVDAIDRRILAALSKDGRMTLQNIAAEVELSRISVAKRLEVLLDDDTLKVEGLVNLTKLDGIVAHVSIEADSAGKHKLLEMLKDCPRVLWLMETTGGYNLVAVLWCENNNVLSALIERCIRPHANRCDVSIGSAPEAPTHCPVKLFKRREAQSPCGMDCKDCEFYLSNKCLGCPAVQGYRGRK